MSSEQRSARMALIKGKDTKPEMLVRKLIHSLGYRYRVHGQSLSGKPDIVFYARKKVIFVHGCFWHHHNDASCRISHTPKSNQVFWNEKMLKNQLRDARNIQTLTEAGWDALVIWECQTKDKIVLAHKITDFLGPKNVRMPNLPSLDCLTSKT